MRAARNGFVPPGFESRVVWIFGSPRSGSTWLWKLLAEHERVVPINEPLIGQYLGPFLSDLPGISADQLDSSNFTLRRVKRDHVPHFFADEFSDLWTRLLGRLMRGRFYGQAVRFPASGPLSRTLVVVKEPNGSQSADVILRALPRSRLLFLLRDGRDVVDSELAAHQPGSWVSREFPGVRGIREQDRLEFVTRSAHKWLWRTEVVQEAFAAHAGPKLLVRYEEMLHDPFVCVASIFDWLDLEISEPQLGRLIKRNAFEELPHARGEREFFRAAKPGLWRRNLTPEEKGAVERVLGAKLRELGYAPPAGFEASDEGEAL